MRESFQSSFVRCIVPSAPGFEEKSGVGGSRVTARASLASMTPLSVLARWGIDAAGAGAGAGAGPL